MHAFSGYVLEVAPGSPADRAGLRVGDRWLNDDSFTRDGRAIGDSVVIKIERDGQRVDLPARVGRICYDEEPR